MEQYFQNIYTSSIPKEEDVFNVVSKVQNKLSQERAMDLDRPFTAAEVKEAVFGTGCTKSSGPDCFHVIFFQQMWGVIGAQVMRVCLSILNGQASIAALNVTNIVLIQKAKNPQKVTEYRPISLCNVLYKFVTKAIANHLKHHLMSLVSNNQSTFLPGKAQHR